MMIYEMCLYMVARLGSLAYSEAFGTERIASDDWCTLGGVWLTFLKHGIRTAL